MQRLFAVLLGVTVLGSASLAMSARADEVVSESRSSSSTTTEGGEKKGVSFKYGERLKNWAEQIDMGTTKGWLSADNATKFKARLEDLRKLNDSVSSKGYPKADLDDMEKQFTQFNIDLSNASVIKPVKPAK